MSDEHGVPTGKQHPGNTPQGTGAGATAGTSSHSFACAASWIPAWWLIVYILIPSLCCRRHAQAQQINTIYFLYSQLIQHGHLGMQHCKWAMQANLHPCLNACAGAGAGGQAPHGSVIGAGTDTPMTAVPVAGAPAGNGGVRA